MCVKTKVFFMKNVLFGAFLCAFCIAGAGASDYTYTETETLTTWERVDYVAGADDCSGRFYSSRDVRPNARPCAMKQKPAQPVRVKTHTEVIDHYQVFQPVTVYKPMGTEIQRRVVPVKNCNKCY